MRTHRFSPPIAWLVICGLFPAILPAALIDTLIERLERSEFVFGQSEGNAPFPPVAWVSVRSFGDSVLPLTNGEIRFANLSASQSLILPVWVGRKDMVLVGESLTWQQITFKSPLAIRHSITSAMPLAAWLHQASPKGQIAAFVAPEFVKGGSYAGYKLNDSTLYSGLLGTYWQAGQLAWIYGGVVMLAQDANTILPYAGLIWNPRKEWTVSLIAPWPTITYSPSRHTLWQFGLSPAGATLATSYHRNRLRVGYDSWTLQLSAHRQVSTYLWVSGGVGWSGFGSFTITSGRQTYLQQHLQRGPVWSLQLSVRPPKPSRQNPERRAP